MTWPELVEVAKQYGFVAFHEGHRMYNQEPKDERRILGLFSGKAAVVLSYAGGGVLFEGPYAEVAEYLAQQSKVSNPPHQERADGTT